MRSLVILIFAITLTGCSGMMLSGGASTGGVSAGGVSTSGSSGGSSAGSGSSTQPSDVAISGNVFTGLNRQAIEADAQCRRIVITGNVMADLNRKTDEKRPALDLRGAQETIVEHNSVAEPPTVSPPK